MRTTREPSSPRLARALLERLVAEPEREFLIGDLEEAFRARLAGGESVRQARRWYWRAALASIAALRERDPQPYRPRTTKQRGDGLMRNVLRDIRLAVRLLAAKPGFSAVAIITLALGIGANTAIFTVFNGLLLKPLPYERPDELVIVTENNLSRGWPSFSVSPGNFLEWRSQTQSFAQIAAYGSRSYNYVGADTPERLRALAGSQGFLELLSGWTVAGRLFRPEEFETGKDSVVILAHGFWLRAFGGRQDVINKPIILNGQAFTIVGVMHPGWRFSARDLSLFTPRSFVPSDQQNRGSHFLGVVGRLKAGASIEAARAEMTAIAARLEAQYPDTNKGWGVVATPLLEASVGNVRPLITLLLGAVGVVLLVACANLANMHMARATGRAREMAVRAALGAGRGRLIQQLLTESLVLAVIGGGLGVLIAFWATSAFTSAYPTLLPRTADIRIDGTTLAFTAGLCIFTALLFGLTPAISGARTRLNETLKEGSRGSGSRLRQLMRGTLVVAEVALALILLTGAGLLLRSFVQLARVDPGFETEGRVMASTVLPQPKYAEAAPMTVFYARVLETLRGTPGEQSAAVASVVPISGSDEIYSIEFEGRPPLPPGQGVSANYYLLSSDYFKTMDIPLRKGRLFTEGDRMGAPRVALVNDTFVRLHYPDQDPIGQRIRMGRNGTIVREIVGVVGNVKHYGLTDRDTAQMYEPYAQFPTQAMSIIAKTDGDAMRLAPVIRSIVQKTDPSQPVTSIVSLDDMLSNSAAQARVQAVLLGGLAFIALTLAAIGLYGVMSYSVSQRTQEIGIRMTLGARRGTVLLMVLRQAVLLTGLGLAIGLGGAVLLAQILSTVLEPLLFQVPSVDAFTLWSVSVGLALVTLIASLIPAHRATRIDPIRALRSL